MIPPRSLDPIEQSLVGLEVAARKLDALEPREVAQQCFHAMLIASNLIEPLGFDREFSDLD